MRTARFVLLAFAYSAAGAACVGNSSGVGAVGFDKTSDALESAECTAWQAGFDAMGNGTGWKHCGDKRDDPCACHMTVCDAGSIIVVKLASNTMGLSGGAMPHAFAALTNLQRLRLNSNGLAGTLSPDFLTQMTALTELHLGNNKLTGTLPAEWSVRNSLKILVSRCCAERCCRPHPPLIR